MTLAVLEGALQPLLEQALDESWTLWHDGLTRPAYGAYNAAQLRTRWGAGHLARVGLVEGGRLLAPRRRQGVGGGDGWGIADPGVGR